jgi:hypothetical protein
MFYSPHHFAAILNRNRLYIIDETFENFADPYEKFVAMDDMSGTNWEVFDPTTIGEDPFTFYYNC